MWAKSDFVFGCHGWYVQQGEPKIYDYYTQLWLDDRVAAIVDISQRTINVNGAEDAPLESVEHFLLDSVLPRLLALDGKLVVHSGLVSSRSGCLCFMGRSGRGKSTLTSSMRREDLSLVTDDAVILEPKTREVECSATYSSLRLFPDSIEAIFGNIASTTRISECSEKRIVEFEETLNNFNVLAIFHLLEPRRNSGIHIERLTLAEGLLAILANSFCFDQDDKTEDLRRFKTATEIAKKVPVYSLQYPRDYARLSEVHRAIFESVGLPIAEIYSL